MARIAPSPSGCGAEICQASLDSPTPSSATGCGSRVSSISAAPSPMVMPLRSRAKGRQRVGDNASRLLKPLTGMRLSVSEPPTITASARPASIRRRPLIMARALEEQAVDNVYAGPSSASQWLRKREGSPSSCCGYCQCRLGSLLRRKLTCSSPSFSPEVLVPNTTPTRSRPYWAMASSTFGWICASAANKSWLLRVRWAEKASGIAGNSPSTPASTASGWLTSQSLRGRIPGETPRTRLSATSADVFPSALMMPTAEI